MAAAFLFSAGFSGVFSFLGGDTPGPEFRENLRERGPRSPANRALGFDPPLGGTRQAARRAGAGTPWRGPVGSLRRRAHPWAGGKAPGGAGSVLPAGTRGGARRRFPPGTGGAHVGRRRGGKTGRRVWAGTPGLWRARARGRAVPRRRGGAAAQGQTGPNPTGRAGRAQRRLFRRAARGGYTAGGGGAAQRGRRQRRLVLRRGV